MSVADSVKKWARFELYAATGDGPWADDRRDPRIRPGVTRHRRWFAVAEFNGGTTTVYYDADPAVGGRAGQIIVYQHDPDEIQYVADTFAAFLRQSNDLLAANLTELMFAEDEYERICHMAGTAELTRQLAAGLDPMRPNWERLDLRAMAARAGRADLVAYLDQHRRA